MAHLGCKWCRLNHGAPLKQVAACSNTTRKNAFISTLHLIIMNHQTCHSSLKKHLTDITHQQPLLVSALLPTITRLPKADHFFLFFIFINQHQAKIAHSKGIDLLPTKQIRLLSATTNTSQHPHSASPPVIHRVTPHHSGYALLHTHTQRLNKLSNLNNFVFLCPGHPLLCLYLSQ